jgi:dienelactone hydrolase
MSWWRRPAVLAGLVVAVVLGGVIVFLVARHSGGAQPAAARTGPVIHTGAEPAEQPNVTAVGTLLRGLPAAFAAGRRDGLTAAAAKNFANVRTALPPGATVAVHPDTSRPARPSPYTRTPGGTPAPWARSRSRSPPRGHRRPPTWSS